MAEQRAPDSTFEDLVTEGAAVPTEGWDFSWFEGRATEARPSWGYARTAGGRLAHATAVLDIQTGGGEVFDFALGVAAAGSGPTDLSTDLGATAPVTPHQPRLLVATEGWAPNVVKASGRLRARGVVVVASAEDAPLPFADGSFNLVLSRHPVRVHWAEIARVLGPGGTYFAQHVGPASVFELVEFFLGPQPEPVRRGRHPDGERAAAEAAGLEVVGLRAERLRMEFHDIAAVVHFLRKVVWMVPGFTVEAYEPQLRALHRRIETAGPFVAHSSRQLLDVRKPVRRP
ncbi:methyltransferase domain-containing protein [Streptomyces fuscichromogenes]|uniref:methyltransferase domain-containing protein n=1 Tax=Streptomyces fuscichromogenes TaxID=1324013 RepID=UPI003811EEDB